MVAPILAMPVKIIKHCFGDIGSAIFSSFILAIVFGIASCTTYQIKAAPLATDQDIAKYLKDDPCMTEMMPRWMKDKGRPLYVGDLWDGKEKCDEMFAKTRMMAQQRKAMAKAKAK